MDYVIIGTIEQISAHEFLAVASAVPAALRLSVGPSRVMNLRTREAASEAVAAAIRDLGAAVISYGGRVVDVELLHE